MSVSNLSASKNDIQGRTTAKSRRRSAAVSAAGMVERLEDRRLLTATIGLVNPDIIPSSNRLIFSTIQNLDTSVPNVVHSEQSLQITDTGSTPLVISSMAISGPWAFVGAPAGGYVNVTVTPTAPLTVELEFTQSSLPAHSYNETNFTSNTNGGAAITGTLTINSNDPTTPSKAVTLAGYWQNESNNNEEPSLQTITNLVAGYETNINSTPIPDLTESTTPTYYGSEVVSTSWEAANSSNPVSVQQLAAFRTEGNTSTVYWYSAAGQNSHQLFEDPGNQAQSLLPTLSNGSLAAANFTPNGAFGIRVDSEYSSDAINNANGNTGGGGHHFRFFPLVDSSGNTVPNTYVVAMDYGVIQAENFDFQDNVFIVSNIRPSGTPETPSNFTATNAAHPVLSWTADTYSPVAYNVYSSTSASGPFTLLNSTPLTTTTYTDTTAASGAIYFQLTAVDTTQNPVATSVAATVSANTGPVAVGYTFSTYSGKAISFNPLVNDTDATGTLNPASVTITTPNHGGTATVNSANGVITYTPAATFTGIETFSYTVSDSNNAVSAASTITVSVTAPPVLSPVVNNEVLTTLSSTPIDIQVLAVDQAATSFNVSSLTIVTAPKDGTAVINTDGSVTYTPTGAFVGGDEFKYTVFDNDGTTSAIATVDINVGTEISSAKGAVHTLVYPDHSGTYVSVTLSKGVADVYFDGTGQVTTAKGKSSVAGNGLEPRDIVLSGTTAASVLKFSTSKTGSFSLGGISDTGPLGSIVAPTGNLAPVSTSTTSSSLLTGSLSPAIVAVATPIAASGTVTLAGVKSVSLKSVSDSVITLGATGVKSTSVAVAGAITDSSITSSVPVSTLKAGSWTDDNTGAASESVQLTAPSVGNLLVGGAFQASLTVDSTGKSPALSNARIAGAVSIGSWNVTGAAKSIVVGSAASTWGGLYVTGNLASFVVSSGGITSDVTAGSINSLKVAGALSDVVTTTGNLLSLQVGQLIDGVVDVGNTVASIADVTTANVGGSTLKSLKVTSKATNSFNDSSVIADVIDSVTTGDVNAANGGAVEGLAARTIKSAAVTVDGGTLHLNASDLLSNAALASFLSTKGATFGSFTIDIL